MSGRTAPTMGSGRGLAHQTFRRWALVEAGATVVGVFVVAMFLRAFHDVGTLSEYDEEAALLLYLAIALPVMWLSAAPTIS